MTSKYDTDPDALAWARAKIQHHIDKAERFSREADTPEKRDHWRRTAWYIRRELIGGEGCVIASFDHRRPELAQALESAATPGGSDLLCNQTARVVDDTGEIADAFRHIQAVSERHDRVQAVARDWAEAQPLLPGQALTDLLNALSDDPQPVMCHNVRVRDHYIRVHGDRVPTPDEQAAIGALLDATEAAS